MDGSTEQTTPSAEIAPANGQQNATKKRWPYRWQRPFLTALARTGTPTTAAEIAKVGRIWAYKVRAEDPEFRSAWQAALVESVDRAEAEARRRSVEGTTKPVLHNGEPVFVWRDAKSGEIVPAEQPGAVRTVLTETRYSDDLLKFWLKGRRPGIFGDKVTHAGDQAQPVNVAHTVDVQHEHSIDPAVLRQFAAELTSAGLGNLPHDGDLKRLDSQGTDDVA